MNQRCICDDEIPESANDTLDDNAAGITGPWKDVARNQTQFAWSPQSCA